MCPGYQVSKQALTKTTLSLFIPPTDDSWARSGSPTAPGIPTMEIFLPNFDPRTPHADFDPTPSRGLRPSCSEALTTKMPTDATDELICNGLICWYDSCSNIAQPYKRQKIPILGRGECTAIVIEQKCCLSYNDPPFPFGVIKDDDFTCKLGLGLSTTGLKKKHDMKNLFSYVCELLTYKEVCQFPFGDKGALPPRHPHAQTLCHTVHFE